MNNKFTSLLSCLVLVVCLFAFIPTNGVSAATNYADGEYNLPVTVLQGDNNDPSKTNDYIISPAKLIVKDGKNIVELTIKNSSWWKGFSVSSGSVSTISDSNDTRVVQFPVQDLNQILNAKIHIVVPDIDYDNKYDVRFKFDTSGLPSNGGEIAGTGISEQKNNEITTGEKKAEENPPTGDSAPIVLLVVLLIGSSLFLARQFAAK